jgi:hypothetical protein
MDLGLKGKSVLVTGGSKGIGLAIADLFAAEGAMIRPLAFLRSGRSSAQPCFCIDFEPASNLICVDRPQIALDKTAPIVATNCGSDLINNLRAYGSRLIAVSVQTELVNLDLLAQNTLAKLRDVNHRDEAELGPLREMYASCRDELSEFRSTNRLKRAARNPARRWTTFGLLFLLIGLESGLNGFFFAKGSDFGLLGGVGTAIGISFVNVLFAFMLGLFPMRWINHRNYFFKLIGVIVTIVGLSGLVALHGFAAHYRDATALVGEDRAFAIALQTLKTSPLVLADLNSFYLFGLGILWAFFGDLERCDF